jgi:hypothetical protein
VHAASAAPPRPSEPTGSVRFVLGVLLRRALSQPASWANGIAGFLARGGLLVFALPVWVLPTPVEVSLLLGPVDVTGPPLNVGLVAAVAVAVGVALLVMAITAAASDLAAYRRLFGEQDERLWESARVVAALVAIEALVLVPAVLTAALTAGRLVEIGRQEYFLPSSLEIPFALRVIGAARAEMLALAACLVAADVAYAILSRMVLSRLILPVGTAAPGGPNLLARAAQAAGAWMAGWVVTAAFVLPGVGLVSRAWSLVQAALAGGGLPGSPAALAGVLVTVVGFVACWGLAVAAGGAASITRGLLWGAVLDRRGLLR